MQLQQLMQSYAKKLGVSEDYLSDLTEDNGVYTLCVESSIFITISEYRSYKDELKVRILSALNGDLSDENLLAEFSDFTEKLNDTSLYGKARIILGEDNSLGLCLESKSSLLNEDNFYDLMQKYVATLIALTHDEDEDEISEKNDILNKSFKPCSNRDYLNMLEALGIKPDDLEENFGQLRLDDSFSVSMHFHYLSGLCIFTNALEVAGKKQVKDFLALNALLPSGITYEYDEGYLRVVSSLSPKGVGLDEFSKAIALQRSLCKNTKACLDGLKDDVKITPDSIGIITQLV